MDLLALGRPITTEEREDKIKLRRALVIQLIIFGVTFLLLPPGFSQVRENRMRSDSGVIEEVAKDFSSITVNEKSFFLSSRTKIVDEKGNPLSRYDLKNGSYVSIEWVRNPGGLMEKRIVVKGRKGVQ